MRPASNFETAPAPPEFLQMIIFTLLSYYILIGSKYENESVYDRVDKIVQNSITNHWFKECLEDNIKEIGCKPTRYEKWLYSD